MDEREELTALRRMAELEAKEGAPASQPQRSLGEELSRQAGLTGRAAVRAVTGIPEMVGNALFGLAGQPGRTTQAVEGALDALGFPRPENSIERVAQVIASAVGGTGALSTLGRLAQPTSQAGRAVAEGFAMNPNLQLASSGTGALSSGMAAEAGLPPLAQFGASLVGGMIPSAPGLSRALTQAEMPLTPRTNNAAVFEQAGTTASAGQATGSNFYQGLENVVGRLPGGQGVIRAFRDRQQQQMGAVTDTGVSAETAGRAIEKGISGKGGFLERTSQQWKMLDDRLQQQVGNDTVVEPTNTIQTLEKLAQRVDEPAINKILRSPKIVDFLNAVKKESKATPTTREFFTEFSMPVTTVGKPGMLPFSTLRNMRSEIGRMIDDSSISSDFKTGELKALYGALSDDIRVAAERSGDQSRHTWQLQNKLWKGRQERVESVLDRVVGSKSPEDVFRAVVPNNPDEVNKIRTVMKSLQPEDRKIVTDAIVARLGKATPGRQNDLGEAFSSETFLTNYNKMSPSARETIFPDLTTRNAMEALAKASSVIREQTKVFPNVSGTAGASAPYAIGAAAFSGVPGMIGAAATVLGANIGMRMLTNPSVVNWLAQGSRMKPAQMASHMSRLSTIYNNADVELKQELNDYIESMQQRQPTASTTGVRG